jgi:hypothetical protein
MAWLQARALIPYYPDPEELYFALENAVECGASACLPALQMLGEFPRDVDLHSISAPRPIYCSSDGSVVWTSQVLAAARRIGGSSFRTFGEGKLVADLELGHQNKCLLKSH